MDAVAMIKGEEKGLYNHAQNTLEAMRTRQMPNADVAIGAKVAKLCHFANISSRVGSGLVWDEATHQFIGNDQANMLAKAYYRAPWELTKIV